MAISEFSAALVETRSYSHCLKMSLWVEKGETTIKTQLLFHSSINPKFNVRLIKPNSIFSLSTCSLMTPGSTLLGSPVTNSTCVLSKMMFLF